MRTLSPGFDERDVLLVDIRGNAKRAARFGEIENRLVGRDEIADLAIAAYDPPVGGRRQRHEAHLLGSAPHRVVRRVQFRPGLIGLLARHPSLLEEGFNALILLLCVPRARLEFGNGCAHVAVVEPGEQAASLYRLPFICGQLHDAPGDLR